MRFVLGSAANGEGRDWLSRCSSAQPDQGLRVARWVSAASTGRLHVSIMEKRRTVVPATIGKTLKRWSGRWDSNPRRPAWENHCGLKNKDNGVYGVDQRRFQTTLFSTVCSRGSVNGAVLEQGSFRTGPSR